MMINILMRTRYAVLTAVLACMGSAWAQQMSPQMHGYINEEVLGQQNAARRRAQATVQQAPKQWYNLDGHVVFAVSFDDSATPDNDKKPGFVVSQESADFDMAADRVQLRCFSPSNCHIFFAFSNMCGAVVQGDLRDGRGTRIYPSYGSAVYEETQAQQQALAHCHADNAVDPASCTVEVSRCAQAKQVYE